MTLLASIEPTWIEQILQTYAAGASDVEVCKVLKVTQSKFNAKYNEDSRFAELVDYGRLTSHSWWLEQARRAINDKTFNTPMWIFVMKNRFGWADKTEAINRLPDEMADLDAVKTKLLVLLPDIMKQLNPNAEASTFFKELKAAK